VATEVLRCTDSFYKRPRFDTCLVRLSDGSHTVARLRLVFTCEAQGQTWQVARVTLFKTIQAPEASPSGMYMLREDTEGAFIDIRWIVRSVFLSATFEPGCPRDFWLNDLVDSASKDQHDLYLRLHATQIDH
jgi:hypothetical protein